MLGAHAHQSSGTCSLSDGVPAAAVRDVERSSNRPTAPPENTQSNRGRAKTNQDPKSIDAAKYYSTSYNAYIKVCVVETQQRTCGLGVAYSNRWCCAKMYARRKNNIKHNFFYVERLALLIDWPSSGRDGRTICKKKNIIFLVRIEIGLILKGRVGSDVRENRRARVFGNKLANTMMGGRLGP